MKESSTKKKPSEGMSPSPFSGGRSLSQSQQQVASVSYFNVGHDMDVPSDDSDGGESQRQKDMRRQRGRKPKPVLSSITKSKDLFDPNGTRARMRRSLSHATTFDSIGFQAQLNGTGTDAFSIGRPSSAASSTTAGRTSSSSQDFFNETQNMNDFLSQSQDNDTNGVCENDISEKDDISRTNVEFSGGSQSAIPLGLVEARTSMNVRERAEVKAAEVELPSISKSKWVVFSIRNPVWDYFLLYADRPIPLEREVFHGMILEAVGKGFSLSRFCQQSNFYALRVEEMKDNIHGSGELEVIGHSCDFVGSTNLLSQTEPDFGQNASSRFSISCFEIHKLFLGLVRRNDIIICLTPNSNDLTGTENTQFIYIHLSSKNTDEGKDLMEYFLDLPPDVLMDICSPFDNDACRSYSVMRFTRSDYKDICVAEILEQTVSAMGPEVASGNSNPGTKLSEVERSGASGNDENRVIPEDVIREKGTKVDEVEKINDVIGGEGGPSEQIPSKQKKNSAVVDDLIGFVGSNNCFHDYLRNVDFIPGPMRPKLRKTKDNYNYVYHKLSKLEEEIAYIVERDCRNKALICPMIPTQCNVYGIVDKTTPDHRHADSYLIRISDETKRSVLVRLHKFQNEEKGPGIEVSDIIRIHRLTVQNEWDPEVGDNTMVLSTSSHHNYVIFRMADETGHKFEYNTSAKSITLDDEVDLPRIAELFQWRPMILPEPVEDVFEDSQVLEPDSPENVNNIPPQNDMERPFDQAVRVPAQSKNACDGICDSDIVSPDLSVANSMDNEEMEIEEEDERSQGVGLIPDLNSSITSDDSFATAVSNPSLVASPKRVLIVNPVITEECEVESANDTDDLSGRTTSGVAMAAPNSWDEGQAVPLTSFKDLRMTDCEISIMSKLISVAASASRNVYHLVLKDFENSNPPKEFQRNLRLLGESQNDIVVLDIVNAGKFSSREIMIDLSDVQGTDEIVVIEGVRMKGDTPPYILEADGRTCVIRRSTPRDLRFLNVDDDSFTFNSSTTSTRSRSSIPVRSEELEEPHSNQDVAIDHDPDRLPVPASSSTLKRPADLEHESGCSESEFSNSFSQISSIYNNSDVPIARAEPWTGKRKGKRKRRLFYRDIDPLSSQH